MPKLIVTADDCGLSEGINQTALQLHRQGYLTAASVMTNFPAGQQALEDFRRCPQLDLGVHLTLTDGQALTAAMPALTTSSRHFHSKFSLFARALLLPPSAIAWIKQELDAQMRRFTDFGIQPQHISTHHHFHTIPTLRKIVYELAARHQVDWVRGHTFRSMISPYNPLPSPHRQPRRFAFAIPAYAAPLQAWLPKPAAHLAARLAQLRGSTELVVHPGPASDGGFPSAVGYGPRERAAETQFLIATIDSLRLLVE